MSAMDGPEKRLIAWWALLAALTLVSLEGAPVLLSARWFVTAVLVIAFIKVRVVILDFMEVRHAPFALRGVLEIWGVAVCGGLLVMLHA